MYSQDRLRFAFVIYSAKLADLWSCESGKSDVELEHTLLSTFNKSTNEFTEHLLHVKPPSVECTHWSVVRNRTGWDAALRALFVITTMKYSRQATCEVKNGLFSSQFWAFRSKIWWSHGFDPLGACQAVIKDHVAIHAGGRRTPIQAALAILLWELPPWVYPNDWRIPSPATLGLASLGFHSFLGSKPLM